MSLTFLYGSTLWIVTSVASAQLAFPGATFPSVLDRGVLDNAAGVLRGPSAAATETASATRNCPHCVSGSCIMCSQSAFRMDYPGCGSYAGPVFDEPCYMSAYAPWSVAKSLAPRATEPDDSPVVAVAPTADVDAGRGGILSAMSYAAEHAPGAGFVRETLSSGVMEASRALALAREWMAQRPSVATAAPPPARSEESAKLRQWFGVDEPASLAATRTDASRADSGESSARPAVTMNLNAEDASNSGDEVAEIDSLVPAEVFGGGFSGAVADGAQDSFVDWEAEVAKAYLAGLHDDCGEAVPDESADPRQDVVTPTIRTAAFALESLGRAAIQLSGRLRDMAENTAIR